MVAVKLQGAIPGLSKIKVPLTDAPDCEAAMLPPPIALSNRALTPGSRSTRKGIGPCPAKVKVPVNVTSASARRATPTVASTSARRIQKPHSRERVRSLTSHPLFA
jgi:hypothetical protein